MCSARNGRRCAVIVGLVVAAMLPGTAYGSLIDPPHNLLPDINAGRITADYDASSGELKVSGEADHYGDGSGPDIDDGYFLIDLTVTSKTGATPMTVSGSLEIDGTFEDGGPSGTLLTATGDRMGALIGTGSAGSNDAILDFTFHVTGGALAGDYGATGGTTVALYYSHSYSAPSKSDVAFTGSFDSSFMYDYGRAFNTADTFATAVVPEPNSAAVALLSIIAGWLFSVARRSRMRRG